VDPGVDWQVGPKTVMTQDGFSGRTKGGADGSARPISVGLSRYLTSLGFFGFFHVEAPQSVLALFLVTICVCCGKAVEVSLVPLFFVDGWRCNLDKTGIAQG